MVGVGFEERERWSCSEKHGCREHNTTRGMNEWMNELWRCVSWVIEVVLCGGGSWYRRWSGRVACSWFVSGFVEISILDSSSSFPSNYIASCFFHHFHGYGFSSLFLYIFKWIVTRFLFFGGFYGGEGSHVVQSWRRKIVCYSIEIFLSVTVPSLHFSYCFISSISSSEKGVWSFNAGGFEGAGDKNPFTPKAFAIRYWDKKDPQHRSHSFFCPRRRRWTRRRLRSLPPATHSSKRLPEFCAAAKLLCFPEDYFKGRRRWPLGRTRCRLWIWTMV